MMKTQMMRKHTHTPVMQVLLGIDATRFWFHEKKITWINWFIIADEPYSYSMLRLNWFQKSVRNQLNSYSIIVIMRSFSLIGINSIAQLLSLLEHFYCLNALLLFRPFRTNDCISHGCYFIIAEWKNQFCLLFDLLCVFVFFIFSVLSITLHHIKYCCKGKMRHVRVRYSKVISLIFQ